MIAPNVLTQNWPDNVGRDTEPRPQNSQPVIDSCGVDSHHVSKPGAPG
jgi:hypothetical protein